MLPSGSQSPVLTDLTEDFQALPNLSGGPVLTVPHLSLLGSPSLCLPISSHWLSSGEHVTMALLPSLPLPSSFVALSFSVWLPVHLAPITNSIKCL